MFSTNKQTMVDNIDEQTNFVINKM
jgi:hypothetical protein